MKLNNRNLLITGGTGSFGKLCSNILTTDIDTIRIFSRDEKQDDREKINDERVIILLEILGTECLLIEQLRELTIFFMQQL